MPSLNFILNYDVPFIKIPSAKITHLELLRMAVKSGQIVVMSTGMSTIDEIDKAVWALKFSGGEGRFILMHTNSAYPCPIEDLNLLTIKFLQDRYQCPVGYSGHEYGLEPTVIAAALGARVIERHITLDHDMWGTDQKASLEIHAMDMLAKRIRDVAPCLGNGVKTVTEREMSVRDKLRHKYWVPGQNEAVAQ
jgi:N-acetylneuraminate synthase